MNIYRNFILFHELNKCQILQHSNNSNYKCLLKTKKVKSEHTVGLTPQNQINTVGMVIETRYRGLWVSTWFATSLASLFIILPPALTSHWPFYFQNTQCSFLPQGLTALLGWNSNFSIHCLSFTSKVNSSKKSSLITHLMLSLLHASSHYGITQFYFLCCSCF